MTFRGVEVRNTEGQVRQCRIDQVLQFPMLGSIQWDKSVQSE
jgi:hypothetical protein